jgi:short-chain fatty acids transporter
MLQPFWALPVLAITGVRVGDLLGYTATFMIAGLAWVASCLWWMSP